MPPESSYEKVPAHISAMRRMLSPEQRRAVSLSLWAVRECTDYVLPSFWRNNRRLEACRDRHKGERCFIFGNGPSIGDMDLTVLKGETVFTLNRGYLLFPRMGFKPKYHVTINPLVVTQNAEELAGLNVDEQFIAWDMRSHFRGGFKPTFIRQVRGPWFGENLPHGLWGGHTVTYAALQIAYFMGFSQVVLLGVDHRFSTQGPPNSLHVSDEPDRNHFDPNYFGPGTHWHLPDLAESRRAYQLADIFYRNDGRIVLDATVGGALDVFPKTSLEEVLIGEP